MTDGGHSTSGASGAGAMPARAGDLLRQYREERRLTQAELGERSAVSWHTISALERGREVPRRDTLGLLADALGLSDDERAALEAVAAAGSTSDRRRDNLPHALTAFVGREAEVDDVRCLVGDHRLVTLTGSGGVGKTRLAAEVARHLLPSMPDGVWLAELAAITDPQQVGHAAAAALGVSDIRERDLVVTLQTALRRRRLLLVLDNCEHVLEACARLTDSLIRECPHVRVLATSREPLGLVGEVAWRVPSFRLPPARPATHFVDDLLRYDAVRLFVDRAATGSPGFGLTEENAEAVAELCRRLDGIPLALELAAARVRVLSVEQLALRLDDRFRLLTGGSRVAVPRHQTLRAAVDWSYELLSRMEQVLFTRLSVFVGSFTLEAVEAVAGDSPESVSDDATVEEEARGPGGPSSATGSVPPAAADPLPASDVLDLLLRLVDKSLVVRGGDDDDADASGRSAGTGGERYRVLETLRAYGRERLSLSPAARRVRRRHLALYLKQAEREAGEAGAAPVPSPRGVDAERQNLWAALRWARDTADTESDASLRALLARVVGRLAAPGLRQAVAPLLFELRRLGMPAYTHLEHLLLQHTDAADLDAGAELYHVIGDWGAEVAVLQRWLAVEPDDHRSARARLRYARMLLVRQNVREATALLDAVVKTAERHHDDLLLLDALQDQGFACAQVGDCHRGRDAYARALALLERLRPGMPDEVYRLKRLAGLHGSGCVAHNADDNAAGATHHAAAVDLARQQRDGPQVALSLLNLADAQWGCWHYGRALQTYEEAEDAATDACYPEGLEFCFLGRGIVLWSIGRYAAAEGALQRGLAVARDLGDVWGEAYGLTYLGDVHAARGELQTALRVNRRAADLARSLGAEYLLAIAGLYRLWRQEAEAPGDPARGPQIRDALGRAHELGLDGVGLHLAWVHLLHRAAATTALDADVAEELTSLVRAFPLDRPARGVSELLGLQLVGALRSHRPRIDSAELEQLVSRVTDRKAESLRPADRDVFRETRRRWDADAWQTA